MKKVLIVEDDQVITTQIFRLLAQLEIAPDHVRSLADARKQAQDVQYDLILSELELHDGPGTDLIRLAGNCPVLIMTSYTSLQTAVDSMRKGAIDYITKPIDDTDLLEALEEFLARRRARCRPTTTPTKSSLHRA